MIVAIFGTTISPYLFFWQASQEAEELRLSHRGRRLPEASRAIPSGISRRHLDRDGVLQSHRLLHHRHHGRHLSCLRHHEDRPRRKQPMPCARSPAN